MKQFEGGEKEQELLEVHSGEEAKSDTGAFEEEEVRRIGDNIRLCLSSVASTKSTIDSYIEHFKEMEASIGEEGNEIVRRQFLQGINCLESYSTILTMIEGMVKELDFSNLGGSAALLNEESVDAEKRFYFLENRVKMVTDIVTKRWMQMEKARLRMIAAQKKPIVKVKKNPLLDTRDEGHNKMNQRLIDRLPANM
jgi:hypothetical protein